jgi:hypothetical protein
MLSFFYFFTVLGTFLIDSCNLFLKCFATGPHLITVDRQSTFGEYYGIGIAKRGTMLALSTARQDPPTYMAHGSTVVHRLISSADSSEGNPSQNPPADYSDQQRQEPLQIPVAEQATTVLLQFTQNLRSTGFPPNISLVDGAPKPQAELRIRPKV